MTAATQATAPVRRPAPPARPAQAAAARADVAFNHDEAEFRLNLGDIPRMRESMDVEGFKPTLLSRLLDLIAPIKP